MTVRNARDYLLEEFTRFVLIQLTVLNDVIEQLAPGHVLHHHEDVAWRVDHLVELDDVRVPKQF